MTDRRTDRRTDARGKTICLPTLKGGDIIPHDQSLGKHGAGLVSKDQTGYRLCYRAWENQSFTYLGIHEARLSCLEGEHYNPEEASPSPSLEEEAYLYRVS